MFPWQYYEIEMYVFVNYLLGLSRAFQEHQERIFFTTACSKDLSYSEFVDDD